MKFTTSEGQTGGRFELPRRTRLPTFLYWLEFSIGKCQAEVQMRKLTENEFERAAREQSRGGIMRELWDFMKENKKWWLLPLVLALLLFGALIFLSGTGLAPFIYTLF